MIILLKKLLSKMFYSLNGIFCYINKYLMNILFINLYYIIGIKGLLILIIWNLFI